MNDTLVVIIVLFTLAVLPGILLTLAMIGDYISKLVVDYMAKENEDK